MRMRWKQALTGTMLAVGLRSGYAQQFGVLQSPAGLAFQPGILSTIAGTGVSGSTGDGGPATAATVTNGIRGIVADNAGDVFFVDNTAGTVRVIYEGGATAAALITAENPAVTSPQVGYIYLLAGKEGTTGTPTNGVLATGTTFKPNAGLTIDAAGNVYFNDNGLNEIFVIYAGSAASAGGNFIALEAGVTNPQLGHVYAIAGSGKSGYAGDGGLATAAGVAFTGINDMKLDAAGNMYIVDQGNNAVREISAKTGVLSTIAGGGGTGVKGSAGTTGVNGPANQALLSTPYGLAVDADGDVYIADKGSNEIKVVYQGGALCSSLILLENAKTVTAPQSGYLYIVAGGGSGKNPYGGLATASTLSSPTMVALDPAGNLYIANNGYNLVTEVNAQTGIMITVAGSITAGYLGDGGSAPSGELSGIRCVGVDAGGRIYITDASNFRIREVSQGIVNFVGQPVGVTSSPQTITLVNTGGTALNFIGGVPQFGGPDASEFAIATSSANTCTLASLAPGASCVLALTYTPNHTGTSAASLTYTTDGVIPKQTITLIGQLTPTITGLAASTLVASPGQSATLTATITPNGTATGTVTFLQGTTVLQTSQLPASGSVSLTVGPLALGAYSYSVKYSGDNIYAASTSNTVTINVGSFTATVSPSTLNVPAGQAAQTTITLTGTGPAAQIVSLSCSGSVTLGCSFSPSLVTIPSNGSTAVILSVAAVATVSNKVRSTVWFAGFAPLLAFAALGMARRRRLLPALIAIGGIGLLLGVSGCSQNNVGTPLKPGTQTLTITATGQGSTPLVQTMQLTVNTQ